MEGTGCTREEAQEALNLSCDWTHNGNPSRVKAAKWLDGRRAKGDLRDGRDDASESSSDCEVVGHKSPGGTFTGKGKPAGDGAERDNVYPWKYGASSCAPQTYFVPLS